MQPMLNLRSLKLCLIAGCVLAPGIALAAAAPPTPDVALKPFSAESKEDQTGSGLAIAAIVNDEVISGYDLDQRVKLLIGASGVKPTGEEMERIRAQVLRELIDERLKLQETKRMKVEVKEQEIADQLSYIASRNNTTPDEIKKQLKQQGISIFTLTDQIKADIAWNELVQGRFCPDVSIDPGVLVVNALDGFPQQRRHGQHLDLFQGCGFRGQGNAVGHRQGLEEGPLEVAHRVPGHYRVGDTGVHSPGSVANQ